MDTEKEENLTPMDFNKDWANEWVKNSETLRVLESARQNNVTLKKFQEKLSAPVYEKVLEFGAQILIEDFMRQDQGELHVLARVTRMDLNGPLVPWINKELVMALQKGIKARADQVGKSEQELVRVVMELLRECVGEFATSYAGYGAKNTDSQKLKNEYGALVLQEELEKVVELKKGIKGGGENSGIDMDQLKSPKNKSCAPLRKSKKVLGRL